MVMGFTKPIEHSTLLTKEGDFMNPLYVGIDVSSKNNTISCKPIIQHNFGIDFVAFYKIFITVVFIFLLIKKQLFFVCIYSPL